MVESDPVKFYLKATAASDGSVVELVKSHTPRHTSMRELVATWQRSISSQVIVVVTR